MSGHNKWSKIKRGKETKDRQRGNIFSKMSRLITLAVIEGGGITDPENNIKLRLAIDKAKQFNMPKENVVRAIEHASGPDRSLLSEVVYEAFAPGGIGLVIVATTDNPNRTLGEIRSILDRHQGKLGSKGSVSYLFQRCGLTVFDKTKVTENQVYEFSEKIGAFDIEENQDHYLVYLPFENLGKIREKLGGMEALASELDYKPQSSIKINDGQMINKIGELVGALEELDDVQHVFSNLDVDRI